MQAIFDFLLGLWRELFPWVIVAPDEGGVRVNTVPRLCVWVLQRAPTFRRWFGMGEAPENGQWVTVLEAGAHWKLPLFGEIRKCKIVPDYVDVDNIAVETTDRKTKLLSITVRLQVHDVRRALLEVADYLDNVSIGTQALAASWGNKLASYEITVERFEAECKPRVQAEALRWGCRALAVGVNSIADHRVYRLIQDGG